MLDVHGQGVDRSGFSGGSPPGRTDGCLLAVPLYGLSLCKHTPGVSPSSYKGSSYIRLGLYHYDLL